MVAVGSRHSLDSGAAVDVLSGTGHMEGPGSHPPFHDFRPAESWTRKMSFSLPFLKW